MKLVFRPEAVAEFSDAALWYEERRAGLGAEFVVAIEETLQRISANPLQFQIVFRDAREAIVRRFPYCVYYRLSNSRITVLAVFHASRNADTWQHRV